MANSAGPRSVNSKATRIAGTTFSLDKRYEVLESLGSGAYGVVVSARDQVTGELVAIKKIDKTFQHEAYAKRTLRELKVLRLLDNETLLKIISIQLPSSKEDFDEIYMVCERMDTDLSYIIKSPQGLSLEHVQLFIYQILRGLNYMHSAGILHRDLKPRNILVNSSCDIKICDFGLCRPFIDELRARASEMTDYVATRWYRAPEVLLSFREYSGAMDIWSVGCIVGELFLRRPLLPGGNTEHQIELILNLLGTPQESDIESIPNKRTKKFIRQFEKRSGSEFEAVFKYASPEALDLLKKMLVFNPKNRISARQAMEHPYFESLHCPEDEPVTVPVSFFDFQYENDFPTITEYKELIYNEMLLYHDPQAKFVYLDKKNKFIQNSLL